MSRTAKHWVLAKSSAHQRFPQAHSLAATTASAAPEGTVWVVADGVQTVPAQSMQWPERLDVAELFDRGQGHVETEFGTESSADRRMPFHDR